MSGEEIALPLPFKPMTTFCYIWDKNSSWARWGGKCACDRRVQPAAARPSKPPSSRENYHARRSGNVGLYLFALRAMMRPMTTSNQKVRRATVEDLQKLVPLWQQENLPWQDLEKRFKEFQVVEGGGGELLGAIGLQIAGLEGRLHSEAFAHAEQADALREKLLERFHIVAGNFGLVRLWTQFATPFWNGSGFQYAAAEVLPKLPPVFAGDPHPWKFIQLKAEVAAPLSIDKEFAMFKEAEKERTEKIFRQARILKTIAAVLAVGIFILVLIMVVLYFRAQARRHG